MKRGLLARRRNAITTGLAPVLADGHVDIRPTRPLPDVFPCCQCCKLQPRECVDVHRTPCDPAQCERSS